MFYPEKMSFVTIASPKDNLKRTIDILYSLKVLHIDDYIPQEGDVPLGKPFEDAEKISELLLDLNFIKSHITLVPGGRKETDFKKASQIIKEVKTRSNSIIEERSQVEEKVREFKKRIKDLEFLQAAGITDSTILGEMRHVSFLAGNTKSPQKVESLLKECEVFYSNKVKDQYPIIIFSKSQKIEEVRTAISNDVDFRKLENVEVRGIPSALKALEERKNSLHMQIEKINTKLVEIGIKYNPDLAAAERFLKESIKKSEVPLRFAVGDHSFLASGWIPSKTIPRLQENIERLPHIHLTIEEAEEGPVTLGNPGPVKPFEFFLNLYSLPKLREIDPTFLVFLSFPIFFGIMLGDIGYGLTFYIAFSILRWRIPKFKGIFDVILLSAIFTVIFGYIFGEFFGAEEILGYHLVPYLHRVHDFSQLMVISLVFGLVHLNLGFIFGFVNELRSHGIRKAILTKASWILLEVSGILLIMDYFFGMPIINPLYGFAVVLVAVIMIFLGEGIIGLIEIPGLISNVLSYLRLAAVGLASALLAFVVNDMAGGMFATGGIFTVMGIGVLIMGHTINILIGLLGGFLQSLRLHYVEMFTKFYGGNGKPYNPFGR